MQTKITRAFIRAGFVLAICLHSISSDAQSGISVIIHSFKDYGGYENFARQAAGKLQDVLNSEKFRQAILTGSFTHTGGLSNQQIYDKIMLAHEVQGSGGSDGIVDLRVRTITLEQDGKRWLRNCRIGSWAGTIGIDGQGDGVTAICSERLKLWIASNDLAQLAAHYAHEYMHILGFSHNGKKKSQTLVYQVGDIVERLIKEGV